MASWSTCRIDTSKRDVDTQLDELRLSRLEVTSDLLLVSLVGGEDLGRVGQDAWLTSCDEVDYPITERYARAIRRWAPWAAGLAWLAKRDNRHHAHVLFGDRRARRVLRGEVTLELDGDGETYADRMLARLNVALEESIP